MKATHVKTVIILLLLFVVGGAASLQADESRGGFITIHGIVKDQLSKKKLEYASVTVLGTSIGTITNADGGFSIKVADTLQTHTLEVSHLGYRNYRLPIKGEDMRGVVISLTPNANALPEVTIRGFNPLHLVVEALNKVAVNNSTTPTMLTGFYRETIKKRRSYINVTEAIVHIYKTSYSDEVDRDRVQVYKGRQLLSPKPADTLAVKLQGGPSYSLYLDVVKNRELLFDSPNLNDYRFNMEAPVMLDDRLNYVVSFEPALVQPYPLFYGKLYIDEENLAFTQAEFYLDVKDRNKATNVILKRKPFNLRFKPEEISYLVTYKQENGHSYLNYIRNEIKFKCDWSRKLFATNYAVVSEVVITNKQLTGVSGIPYKQAFNIKHVLSDKVSSFYDDNYWEGYNIIEPTESLEAAVNKLKR